MDSYAVARRSARRAVRIPVSVLLELAGQKVARKAYVYDLSQHGVRIEAGGGLVPGQIVQVVPSEGPTYAVSSRVVWVGAPGSERDGQAGLEFLAPNLPPN